MWEDIYKEDATPSPDRRAVLFGLVAALDTIGIATFDDHTLRSVYQT